MLLSKLLNEHPTLSLDTAVFVYHLEQDNQYFPLTQIIFRNIQSNQNKGITTVVSLAEILIKPMQIENIAIIEDYRNVLNNFPNLTILDIDQKTALLAARLRAKYKIKLPDALQVAGGLTKNTTLFITNDKKLKIIKEIKVIALNDLLKS